MKKSILPGDFEIYEPKINGSISIQMHVSHVIGRFWPNSGIPSSYQNIQPTPIENDKKNSHNPENRKKERIIFLMKHFFSIRFTRFHFLII